VWAKAHYRAGVLAVEQGEYAREPILADQSVALFQELGDATEGALALVNLAGAVREQGTHWAASSAWRGWPRGGNRRGAAGASDVALRAG
jgi:hypothetical protein